MVFWLYLSLFTKVTHMKFTLSHLDIGYQPQHNVISDINVEVISGGLTCLIGPNGVGKSTLLKTLSGFLPKLGGEILLNKLDLSHLSNKDLARKISVVLTTKPDVQNITTEEMIGLGRSPYTGFFGTLRKEDEKVVNEVIETVGITSLKGRAIHTLSDGERQKVMIAKALAQETPIILLDEPTAFLDFPSKADTYRLLHETAQKLDKIILLSTHDLELAIRFSDTILEVSKQGVKKISRAEVEQNIEFLLNI